MEESDLIDDLVAKGATDEEIELLVQDFRANRKPEPGVLETAAAGVGGFNRGISQVVSAPLKLVGAAGNWLESKIRGTEVGPNIATRAGQAIEDFTEEINPYNENVNDTYQNVAQGLGQGVGMLATGGTSAAPSIAAKTPGVAAAIGSKLVSTPAVIGGAMTAVPEWEAAKAAGLDDDQAFESLVKNYLVGTTEAVPVQNLISRLNKVTGNRILETVKNMGIGSLEEAIQEATQTYATNEFAKDDYDPDRDPLFNVLESAKVGGIVGFILPGIGAYAKRLPAGNKVKVERKIAELQADKAIAESSIDPEIDAEIDSYAEITPEEKALIESKNVEEAVEQENVEIEKVVSEIEKEATQEAKEATEAKKPKPKVKEGAKPTVKPVEPDLMATATRKVEEAFKAMDEATTDADRELAYKTWSNAKQALRAIAPETKSTGKKTDIQKQIEDTTGITKQEPIVIKNPAQALKQQIQQHYKTLEEGVRKGQKMTNENLVTKVQEAVKSTDMTPQQVNAILNKVKRTNLFTPGSQSKLNDFITKVTNEADYANNLAEARTVAKKIKKLSKNEKIPQNLRNVAKSFATLPVDEVGIATHLKLGQEIMSGLSSNVTDGKKAFNTQVVNDYVEKIRTDLEPYTEEVEVGPPADPEEKSKKFRVAATFSLDALKNKDLTDLDESERSKVKALTEIDINKLKDEDLRDLVRKADNITENDDFSGVDHLANIAKWQKKAEELKADLKGVKTRDIKSVGALMANIPQLMGRVFGESNIAAKVRSATGIADVFYGGPKTELKEKQLTDRFDKLRSDIKKKTGKDINDIDNQAEVRVAAELIKSYGDDSHIPLVKKNIIDSISRYEKNKEPEAANALKKAFSKYEKVTTVQEAMDIMKKSPAIYENWKFFNDTFQSEVNSELEKVTTDLQNKTYRTADNYSRTDFVKLEKRASRSGELASEDPFMAEAGIKPKQTSTSMTATRRLPIGQAYSLSFNYDQMKAYRESVYAIETARARDYADIAMSSPEFEEIMGSKENAEFVQDMVIEGERIQRGTSRAIANRGLKFVNNLAKGLRDIASVRALGSFAQAPKQVLSVETKALFNHLGTGSLDSYLQGIRSINLAKPSQGLEELWAQYPIGARGLHLGGTDRGEIFSSKLNKADTFNKVEERVTDMLKRKALFTLTRADAYAARTTWNGYYLQSLKEQGVKNVDMDTEYQLQGDEKRKIAAAFAEQKISETQAPSNPAELAQISRNDSDVGWKLVKSTLLPFSNFSITSKYRHIQEFERAVRNPSAANLSAAAGNAAEIAVYAAVAVMLFEFYKPMLKNIVEKMTGVDAPDDDEELQAAKRDKAVKGLIVNQISPLAIGTLGELATAKIANAIAWAIENPDSTYAEWKKETGGIAYEDDKFDLGLYSLGGSVVADVAKDAADLANVIQDEPVKYDGFMGTEKEADLDKPQSYVLMLKTLFDTGALLGITEADWHNQIKAVYKEQLKEASKEPAPSGNGRRRPRPRPRLQRN